MDIKFVKDFIADENDFVNLPQNHPNYDFWVQQSEELKGLKLKEISSKEFVKAINQAKNKNLLFDLLENVKTNFIYSSWTHGINHNIRVALFAFYIANALALDDRMITLAIYASLYHDTGRVDDEEDAKHGLRSANRLDEIGLNLPKEDLKILKTAIISHSIDDCEFESVAKKMRVKDITNCTTLFKILKDADGLDRVRLEAPYVRYDFLRNEVSKRLVPLSYIIEYNYADKIQ